MATSAPASFQSTTASREDLATGSAAIVLCHRLARPIVIDQGTGSIIEARPLGDGAIELGGRVVSDGTLRLER